MSSTITSIRLPAELLQQLDQVSKELHRKKNWVIVQALTDYLQRFAKSSLQEEAKRQSILASKASQESDDSEFWEDCSDQEGWEG